MTDAIVSVRFLGEECTLSSLSDTRGSEDEDYLWGLGRCHDEVVGCEGEGA